jgi:hypothetical protein
MKTLVTFVGAADNVIALIITIIENIAKKQNKTCFCTICLSMYFRSSTYNLLKPGTQYSLICIQQEQQDLRMS